MGLYGNVMVDSPDPDYWAPAHRELALTLDDVLIEDGQIAPFSPAETNYAAMGRFGNVLLVAGETDLRLTAQPRRGRASLPDQHRQHAGVQGQAARGAHEARRRRQRPGRARAARRGGRPGAVRAGRRRRPVRAGRRARAGAPHARARLPPGVDRGRRAAGRAAAGRQLPNAAPRSGACPPNASGSPPTWMPSRTRRSRSSPRWTSESPRGRSSTPAPCTPTSCRRSPAAAPSAA